jgi:co-chaperonin GroES (HSP10)
MNELPFKPLSNFIIVEEIERKKTDGGLIVPDNAKEAMNQLTLVDHIVVGISEEVDENNKPMVKNVKIGDRVCLGRSGGEGVVIINKKPYLCIREMFVIGIYTDPYVRPVEPKSCLTLAN